MAVTELDAAVVSERPLAPLALASLDPSADRADIAGILIDRLPRTAVLARIEQLVESGRPHQVVTVNADFLNIADRDPSFATLLNAAAISVPDGMPLVWISRMLGTPLSERITGTDLLLGCSELAAARGYRLFLLGAAPGVAGEAAAVLAARYPNLQIVGSYTPPYYAGRDAAVEAQMVAAVRAAQPDMLFVAMGTPKQEQWIYDHLAELEVPVCIGVGGVFNFITGRIPRAPLALQQMGLEWLFRLVLEPRRLWKRYLVDDTQALARVLLRRRRARRAANANTLPTGVPTGGSNIAARSRFD